MKRAHSTIIWLALSGKETHLRNTVYNTIPLVIHANGPTKLFLNTLGNYIPKAWNEEEGCLGCWDEMKSLEKKKVNTTTHKYIKFVLNLLN